MAEVVTQVAVQVMGNDTAVAVAGSQGNFELNVFLPVMARNLYSSIDLLTAASRAFADSCVDDIEADAERCRAYAEATAAVATALNPLIGYEQASAVVKEAVTSGRSVREVVTERGFLPVDELDRALDVLWMTKGGVTG
jgi:fumarate hydratase class II